VAKSKIETAAAVATQPGSGARDATWAFMIGKDLGMIACTAVLAAGCGAHDEQDATATTTEGLEPSAATSVEPALARVASGGPGYVVLESPAPSCEANACGGGFWVRQLEDGAAPQFVASLDISAVARGAIAQMVGVSAGEVLLLGQFAPDEGRKEESSFVVLGAWRGMPGVAPPAVDQYATIGATGSGLVAYGLDGQWRRSIEAVSLTDLGPTLVDTSWLTGRVVGGGAIVAGQLQGTTFDAAQIFVRLPDLVGPCPLFEYFCGESVATYALGADRCLFATGCAATRHVCPQYLPGCDPEYQRLSWPIQPDGCLAYACMPAFLAQ
jgi:hypothetical protein